MMAGVLVVGNVEVGYPIHSKWELCLGFTFRALSGCLFLVRDDHRNRKAPFILGGLAQLVERLLCTQ